MRARLDLAYDGSAFHGWAKQDDLRTVQGEIEFAIERVSGSQIQLTVAGRTDAGVHARGQVAHLDIADDVDLIDLEYRLKKIVPHDIAIYALTKAPDDFDARFSAIERSYTYRLSDQVFDPLLRNQVVAYPKFLNTDAMNSAGQLLLGEHDFAAFCKKREGATTIRTLLELSSQRIGAVIETTVRADAFCHSMVRSLMGAIVAVGEGRFEPAWVSEILRAKVRNPQVKVMPAHGLVLEQITYPPDDQLAARATQARNLRTVRD